MSIETIKLNNTTESVVRICEICGIATETRDNHICPECKRRLKQLLYGETLETHLIKNGKTVLYTLPCLDIKK